ncbi:hypothetical protein GCM10009789_87660 [Kribbella sancticallisti]|uniref:DNA-binding protein HU-beta n=1 Tax=Kribbella sancticallisti TaxID=460087 RepID=A0ABN2EX43_9ACTN
MSTTRKTAPKAQTVPASSRGKAADPAKYALFAQWAEKEFGFKLDPSQAQFAVLQYKHFQASDLNKKFNAAKAASSAKKAAPTPTTKPTAKKAPAKKTTAKKATPAKAKTTRTRKAAA